MLAFVKSSFIWVFVCLIVGSVSAHEELTPTHTVMVPMRDGTKLPTDLYFPNGVEEKLPCILMRCPSGRGAYPWKHYATLAEAGYVVAIQDTRSALDPEGKCFPYHADGWGREQDGYDTVEWLAKSPFTNGKVGTIGFSAVGITQQMMAPSAPPSLKCQYIGVAAGSIYHHAAFTGGQLHKNQVEGWLGGHAKDPSVYNYILSQPKYNDFWKGFDSISVADRVNTPAIHYGGWYDTFLQGTIDSFVARQERGGKGARGKQKLLIGPWTHHWPHNLSLGDFEVPDHAKELPESFSPLRWFARYLKDDSNDVDRLPAVTYYVMGPFNGEASSGNVWRTAEHWPPPGEKASLYLACGGKLTLDSKPKEAGSVSYEYDPKKPVPTIGGRNLFLESGPKDQRPVEEREDVIVFTSEPLTEDIEIVGQMEASLRFASELDDVDVAVRFCDVYPDGRSVLISDSICRVTDGLKAGVHKKEPIDIHLDLASTAIVIAKGHRMRLSIASSNFPRYEHLGEKRALIEGKTFKSSVYVGGETLSRLVLPIVRRGNQWYEEKK